MLYIGIVLYNSLIEHSKILTTDINGIDCTIIFSDNSDIETIRRKNQRYAEANAIQYKNNNGNIGLSRAYNSILKQLPKDNKEDYLMWLDDDTEISNKFIRELILAIKDGYDVIMPKIVGQEGIIYSPNEYGYLKNRLILNKKRADLINFNRINAINSCLTVRLQLYKEMVYNEQLFLDQVDQLFFDNIRKLDLQYKVLASHVNQNFSQRNEIIGSSYLARFIIRKKDILTYGRLSPVNNIFLSRIKILMLSIKFTMKTKDFSYLKEGIK
ncbi:glycosyltransferase [Enterococcus dongliensis]|uniref:Glycosyltransferase n=1 Tax=Enterococcus dongliensis TaxID=2559925 RepID=A0AAP5NMQ7_9ENTE|nr:glycosyltransferase [Enterococcus dongliensis]MDT2596627.1 glycosyltransferase [Enterococcus dongliensis]MDT2634654.1 glycosyltransferase [Enterococcus dongliensis]MDT2637522.1 glycosyltransferase [Enterococcus dongliensis]MDT2642672.1 glycosyltransferase [Enterococcus dongliensis]MDT2647867.1 glycosyltransferase [Enterococcus dongliensis]